MESSVYNTLGSKINRTFPDKREEELTLKHFLDNKFVINNESELKKVFITDLKSVLKSDDLYSLIHRFFELEQDLSHAMERLEFDTTIVNFDEFYKNLSPVLMRALLENASEQEDAQVILKSIRESLRIALEEELYQLEDYES
jgi:hypothetical protein